MSELKDDWKEVLIQAVIQQRGVASSRMTSGVPTEYHQSISSITRVDEDLIETLNSLAKEDLTNIQFLARVITELDIFDIKVGNSDSPYNTVYMDNQSIMEKSLESLEGSVVYGEDEYTGPRQYTGTGVQKRYINVLPNDFVQEVSQAFDLSSGVSGVNSEEAGEYFEYLKVEVNDYVKDTGNIAVIAKPKGGNGYIFFSSDYLNEVIENKGTADLSIYSSFSNINDAGLKYYPVTEEKDGVFVPTGEWIDLPSSYDDDGNVVEEVDKQTWYAVATQGVAGDIIDMEKQQLTTTEVEKLQGEGKILYPLQGADEEAIDMYYLDLEKNLTGLTSGEFSDYSNLPDDYFIYKQIETSGWQEPSLDKDFLQDAKEQITVSDYGRDNLYGGFDHISGDPAQGKISWISLPPEEKEAVQLELMQAGFLSPDAYFSESGSWGRLTQTAMQNAMIEANYEFKKIGPFLSEKMRDYKNRPPIYPKVYLEPSPAFIKNELQTTLKAIGARTDLSPAELAALSDYWIQSDIDAEKAAIDWQHNVDLAQRMINPTSRLQAPQSASERTEAYAKELFEPELRAKATAEKRRNDLSYLTYTVDRMSDMIGG